MHRKIKKIVKRYHKRSFYGNNREYDYYNRWLVNSVLWKISTRNIDIKITNKELEKILHEY